MMQVAGLDVDRYEVYLPKKPGRQGRYNNFGYGFVTCYGSEDAELFTRTLQGFHFENIASSKCLVIEPGRGNAPVELLHSAWCQPGSPDARRAAAQAHSSFAVSQSAAAPSYFPGSTSVVEHHTAFSAAQKGPRECWTVSGVDGPDASNVPLTRLAVDEKSAARSEAESRDAFLKVSPPDAFRFQ
eukprot:TRINITY_DN2819_c0_g1_i1.p1 TRINITY_DN2819_c0_g1~~TRINITY_DN2819_c0_g1_i1.p1  ORF type:complete len:209 (+),score=27.05 TRINITY_DN2819_c0_g1_i1:73-627(+)